MCLSNGEGEILIQFGIVINVDDCSATLLSCGISFLLMQDSGELLPSTRCRTPESVLCRIVYNFITLRTLYIQLLSLFPTWFSIMFMQPHVDFGLKLLGADAMSIPGLYRFVQVVLQFLVSDQCF